MVARVETAGGEGWMSASEDVWRLYRGEELLGEIRVEGADFPWLYGRFLAQPGFAAVRPMFERELALVESEDEGDLAAWEAAYQPIAQTMRLLAASGPVAELLLHVRGEEAWFRCSDEP